MLKRTLSILLTLAVVFALIPAMPITAVAEDYDAVYQWNLEIYNSKGTDEATLAYYLIPSLWNHSHYIKDEDGGRVYTNEPGIDSDAVEIIELATSLTQGIKSDYEKAKVIHDWVANNIWYNRDFEQDEKDFPGDKYTVEFLTASGTLRNKRNLCGGYAKLTTALLRAAGVPAKSVTGYEHRSLVSHAWTEAYADGRWIIIDTTWDSNNVYENGKFSPQRACDSDYFDISLEKISQSHKYDRYMDYSIENGLVIGRYKDIKEVAHAILDREAVTEIVIPEGVTSIRGNAYVFAGFDKLENITFPNSLTSIGLGAFSDCANLTSVTLPNGLTNIGNSAFANCKNLNSIIIPDSVTTIAWSAFNNCHPNLVIYGAAGSYAEEYAKENGFLFGTGDEKIIITECTQALARHIFDRETATEIIIPDGITSIGDAAFNKWSKLTNITLPNSLISIERAAFNDCTGLTSVVIPEGVTSIGDSAFNGCTSLTSIVIPGSVTSIGRQAFFGCTSLTSVVIPEGVTSIGGDAFGACTNLVSVVVPESVTKIDGMAFGQLRECVIYGVAGSYAEEYANRTKYKFIAGTPIDTASDWAREGITSAITKGFVPGSLQSNYTDVITRLEFCRMALKWLEYKTGKPVNEILSERNLTRDANAFTDTSDSDILAAFVLGITNGTGEKQFTPNGQFSREQAATMIRNTCKAAGMDISNITPAGFEDIASASDWAVDGINFCRNNGIMNGTSATPPLFSPQDTYTREQSIITFNNIK